MKRILTIIFMMMSTYVLADTPYDDWELTYESIVPGAEPSDAAHSALDYVKLISEPITYEETIIFQESDGTLSLDVGPTIEVTRDSTVDATIDALIGLINYDLFGQGVTEETIDFNNPNGYVEDQMQDILDTFFGIFIASNAIKNEFRNNGGSIVEQPSYINYLLALQELINALNVFNGTLENYRDYIETLTELQ